MVAQRSVELKSFGGLEKICDVRGTGGDLFAMCHINRGPHFEADGFGQRGTALVILLQQLFHQFNPGG